MNKPAPVRILNAQILPLTSKQLLENLHDGLLVTPNIDHLMILEHDDEFRRCYSEAEWVVCDSRIIYFCSQLLSKPLPEAIPGSSFFTAYYTYHRNDPGCRIFLLGAAPGIAAEARRRINLSVGREIIVGEYSPVKGFEHDPEESERMIRAIAVSEATVVAVGLGAPKQEKWIVAHRHRLPDVHLWMAIGATIDFEAGNVRRAPLIMQRLGLEWLYRFTQEPRRLFRRYFINDIRFFPLFIWRHLIRRR